MRTGTRWAIAGVLAVALIGAACGGTQEGADSGTGGAPTSGTGATGAAGGRAAGATIKRGGTLVAALGNNPKTFDPMLANDVASAAVTVNVFEGLYKYDENLKPVPWLAERVEITPDNQTYTFFLRTGVRFHDGTELDAEAVKFSIERIKNNKKVQSWFLGSNATAGYAEFWKE